LGAANYRIDVAVESVLERNEDNGVVVDQIEDHKAELRKCWIDKLAAWESALRELERRSDAGEDAALSAEIRNMAGSIGDTRSNALAVVRAIERIRIVRKEGT